MHRVLSVCKIVGIELQAPWKGTDDLNSLAQHELDLENALELVVIA